MKHRIKEAASIARKNMAGHVHSFQAMEGMSFTLPEVQTCLQGVTIGGHRIADVEKLKQQALGWSHLIELVEAGEFRLTKDVACSLERIVAKEDALEPGVFRTGVVSVAGRERPVPDAGRLDRLFDDLCKRVDDAGDVLTKGVMISLDMANQQYFWDGNKRTGLLLMNGVFMSNGMPPLSIPANRLLTYNEKMLRFHNSGNDREMMRFMSQLYELERLGAER
jgi:Fic family protein